MSGKVEFGVRLKTSELSFFCVKEIFVFHEGEGIEFVFACDWDDLRIVLRVLNIGDLSEAVVGNVLAADASG